MAHPNPKKDPSLSKNYYIYLLSAQKNGSSRKILIFLDGLMKIKRRPPTSSMRSFNSFINRATLIDLPQTSLSSSMGTLGERSWLHKGSYKVIALVGSCDKPPPRTSFRVLVDRFSNLFNTWYKFGWILG